ncbi:hypothetical protein IAU59_004261 [Kwoniella sp. CBS 9459]
MASTSRLNPAASTGVQKIGRHNSSSIEQKNEGRQPKSHGASSVARTSSSPGPGAGSSPQPDSPALNLHLHPSVQAHFATELSFLHTLIRRARDQHRLQLFLRRMYDVLRIGKALLGFVRQSVSAKAVGQGEGQQVVAEGDADAGRLRKRGTALVSRMIKSLYTAHRHTAQIIELHHFLPLQTSVLSIYARLFVLTLNVANALNMDIERVIASGGQLNKPGDIFTGSREKKGKGRDTGTERGLDIRSDLDLDPEGMARASSTSSSMGMVQGDVEMALNLGLGTELGERIERRPPPARTLNAAEDVDAKRERSIWIPTVTVDHGVPAPPEADLDRENHGSTASREISSEDTLDELVQNDTNATTDTDVETGPTTVTKTKKRQSSEAEGDPLDDVIASDEAKAKVRSKVKIKAEAAAVEGSTEKTKKKKKTKTKKDDMDDIFGF